MYIFLSHIHTPILNTVKDIFRILFAIFPFLPPFICLLLEAAFTVLKELILNPHDDKVASDQTDVKRITTHLLFFTPFTAQQSLTPLLL